VQSFRRAEGGTSGGNEGPCQESNGHMSNLCEVDFSLPGRSYSEYVDLTELGATPTKGMKIPLSVLPSNPMIVKIPRANASTLRWIVQTAGWIVAGAVIWLMVLWRRRAARSKKVEDRGPLPTAPLIRTQSSCRSARTRIDEMGDLDVVELSFLRSQLIRPEKRVHILSLSSTS
jgi:hypothetical protein